MSPQDKTFSNPPDICSRYNVVQLKGTGDNVLFQRWFDACPVHMIRLCLSIASWVFSVRFIVLLWRTLPNVFETSTFVASCYLGVQISLLFARISDDGWRFLCTRPKRRPRLRLVDKEVPYADVIITTCGEDLDIVMDSARAACDLDYPAQRYRVLVSDDAANPILESIIKMLAAMTPVTLLYFSRPDKRGMKAGNMNAALSYLQNLRAAEYCTFSDVDMILEPDFLRATLPHLTEDDTVGAAVVPQRFYNVPVNDPLYQSLNVDGRLDETQRDSMGSAWVTGPGVMFRSRAIAEIGGFPENALAEDILTGFLLQGRGWKLVYCGEELQFGLVPDTFQAHVAQRIKWFVGRFRNSCRLNCAIKSPLLKSMSWKQRAAAICHCASPVLSMMNRPFCSWLLLALVSSGQPLIIPQTANSLESIIDAYLVANICAHAEELLTGTTCGYFSLRRRIEGMQWLNTHLFFALIRDMLPTSLGGFRVRFVPTALQESKLQERHANRRPGLMKRLRIMAIYQNLWYHIAIITAAATIFDLALGRAVRVRSLEYLLTHVMVPGIQWSCYSAAMRPIAYAIWPPLLPKRRDLMERSQSCPRTDHETKKLRGFSPGEDGCNNEGFDVWRPKTRRKIEQWNTWAVLPEVPRNVELVFWAAMFLGR